MTREEAIEALKDLVDMNVRYGCDDKWITALHMAIEALTEAVQDGEPCPFCGGKGRIRRILDIDHDVVQVVRCKDCKHRFYDEPNEAYMCDRHEYGESFGDDDFCSYGERRKP